MLRADLTDQSATITKQSAQSGKGLPVLGLTQSGSGRLAVFGDTSCVDDAHLSSPCLDLVTDMVVFATTGTAGALRHMERLKKDLGSGVVCIQIAWS